MTETETQTSQRQRDEMSMILLEGTKDAMHYWYKPFISSVQMLPACVIVS